MFRTNSSSQAARALSPEEQEEYDQFHKHQAKGTGKLYFSFSSAYFVVCTLVISSFCWAGNHITVNILSACRQA